MKKHFLKIGGLAVAASLILLFQNCSQNYGLAPELSSLDLKTGVGAGGDLDGSGSETIVLVPDLSSDPTTSAADSGDVASGTQPVVVTEPTKSADPAKDVDPAKNTEPGIKSADSSVPNSNPNSSSAPSPQEPGVSPSVPPVVASNDGPESVDETEIASSDQSDDHYRKVCDKLARIEGRLEELEDGANRSGERGKTQLKGDQIGKLSDINGSLRVLGVKRGSSIAEVTDSKGNHIFCGLDVKKISKLKGNVIVVGGNIGDIESSICNIRVIDGEIRGRVSRDSKVVIHKAKN